MKAVGIEQYDSDFAQKLKEITLPVPTPGPRDILVKVSATATNPIDYKMLQNAFGLPELKEAYVTGWDVAGTVVGAGAEAKLFENGTEVYFAGNLFRAGGLAEYVTVDERLVAKRPQSIGAAEAASIPLTFLTVWEALFENLRLPIPKNDEERKANASKTYLAVAGAGGVGSIGIQIVKKVLGYTVVATASRPETKQWCLDLGADHVINHREDVAEQVKALGIDGFDIIYDVIDLSKNFDTYAPLLRTLGAIIGVNPPSKPLNTALLFSKRATLTLEFMGARPAQDLEKEKQGQILAKATELLESGVIRHTMNKSFDFTVDGVKGALELQASGKAVGKVVVNVA